MPSIQLQIRYPDRSNLDWAITNSNQGVEVLTATRGLGCGVGVFKPSDFESNLDTLTTNPILSFVINPTGDNVIGHFRAVATMYDVPGWPASGLALSSGPYFHFPIDQGSPLTYTGVPKPAAEAAVILPPGYQLLATTMAFAGAKFTSGGIVLPTANAAFWNIMNQDADSELWEATADWIDSLTDATTFNNTLTFGATSFMADMEILFAAPPSGFNFATMVG